MNETLFCSEPRLVPSFEERYSAESADWKKRGSCGCIGQGSKKAGWLGLSRAVKNDIILEAERMTKFDLPSDRRNASISSRSAPTHTTPCQE